MKMKIRTHFFFNSFSLLEKTKAKQTKKLAKLIHPMELIFLKRITVSFVTSLLSESGSAIVHIAKEDSNKAQVIFSNDFGFLHKI